MKKMKNSVEKSNIFVYTSRFPFEVDDEKIFPPARAEEIESSNSDKVRREKFYVWKLLELALAQSLGLKAEEMDFRRTDNGKWECKECFFSLSHSGNFVAVAVSEEPVGVDIEKFDKSRFNGSLAEKIATEREKGDISPQNMTALWTKKEAIFKLSGGKAFIPKNIETADYTTVTKTFQCGDENYFISVASPIADKAEFFSLNDLDFTDYK